MVHGMVGNPRKREAREAREDVVACLPPPRPSPLGRGRPVRRPRTERVTVESGYAEQDEPRVRGPKGPVRPNAGSKLTTYDPRKRRARAPCPLGRAGVRGKGRCCLAPVPSSPPGLIFTHFESHPWSPPAAC